mmetsp:Transcript_17501/g.32142  ORF Transcript_17501/g.32142 Transcript_17501/m.32142 type:complete len:412 (+) Transcript_17501:176-1411(+)
MGRKNKPSKYKGKHLNESVAAALSGPASKPNEALFFEDATDGAQLSRKEALRKKRDEEDRQLMEDLINAEKLKSKGEALRVEKRLKNLGKNTQKVQVKPDFWDAWDGVAPRDAKPEDDWLEVPAAPGMGKQIYKKSLRHVSTKNPLPAVIPASAGSSYNPSAEALQEGISKVVRAEHSFLERLRKLDENVFKEAAKSLNLTPEELEESDEEDESDDEEEEEDKIKPYLQMSKTQRKKLEKKGRAQRNKEKRGRLRKVQEAMMRNSLLQKDQITKIEELIAEMEEKEKDIERSIEAKKLLREKKKVAVPIPVTSTGKKLFREPAVDVILPSDLTKTMREMKPHGNLALDRFASLHMRNKFVVPNAGSDTRKKRKGRGVKAVEVGQKFMEEDFTLGDRKKKRRYMRGGRVDIS